MTDLNPRRQPHTSDAREQVEATVWRTVGPGITATQMHDILAAADAYALAEAEHAIHRVTGRTSA